mgnify:CR=1 FL=1
MSKTFVLNIDGICIEDNEIENTTMNKEEFYKWLHTCPCEKSLIKGGVGSTTIMFEYLEEVNDD